MSVVLKVGMFPGAIKTIEIAEGSTIAQAVDQAGFSVQGKQLKVNGNVTDNFNGNVEDAMQILLVSKITGNSDVLEFAVFNTEGIKVEGVCDRYERVDGAIGSVFEALGSPGYNEVYLADAEGNKADEDDEISTRARISGFDNPTFVLVMNNEDEEDEEDEDTYNASNDEEYNQDEDENEDEGDTIGTTTITVSPGSTTNIRVGNKAFNIIATR